MATSTTGLHHDQQEADICSLFQKSLDQLVVNKSDHRRSKVKFEILIPKSQTSTKPENENSKRQMTGLLSFGFVVWICLRFRYSYWCLLLVLPRLRFSFSDREKIFLEGAPWHQRLNINLFTHQRPRQLRNPLKGHRHLELLPLLQRPFQRTSGRKARSAPSHRLCLDRRPISPPFPAVRLTSPWVTSSPRLITAIRFATISTSFSRCDESITVLFWSEARCWMSSADFFHPLRVKSTCWFIKDNKVRIGEERLGNAQTLLHAMRIRLHLVGSPRRNPTTEDFPDPLV